MTSSTITYNHNFINSLILQNENNHFDENTIQNIYHIYLNNLSSSSNNDSFNNSNINFSGYLECYLLKYLSENSSKEHILSILIIFNQKLQDGILIFQKYYNKTNFQIIFNFILTSFPSSQNQSLTENISILRFLIYAFQNLDYEPIRNLLLKYFSLHIWKVLSPERLNREFKIYPQLEKHWEILEQTQNKELITNEENNNCSNNNLTEKDKKKGKRKNEFQEHSIPKKVKPDYHLEIEWFPSLIEEFLFQLDLNNNVETIQEVNIQENNYKEQYLDTFCEFFSIILSQFSTRRFTYTVFDDYHVLTRCKRSLSYERHSFKQLVDSLYSLVHFNVNNLTGKSLSTLEMDSLINNELQQFQQIAYNEFRDTLSDIIFSSTGELGKEENLFKHLSILPFECLLSLAQKLGYISSTQKKKVDIPLLTKEFIIDILIEKLTYKKIDHNFTSLILDPNEKYLWNTECLLVKNIQQNKSFGLSQLNTQYLTLNDYLTKNFNIFQLESAYNIRIELEKTIKLMAPRQLLSGKISYAGSSQMGIPVVSFRIEEIIKPDIGNFIPSSVTCSVEIDLSKSSSLSSSTTTEIKNEWEDLSKYDILFLITIQNPSPDVGHTNNETKTNNNNNNNNNNIDFQQKYGVKFVRVGEVIEFKDEDNIILNNSVYPERKNNNRAGTKRKLKLHLDPTQYYEDMKNGVECYENITLLVRYSREKLQFKSILKTIKDLIITPTHTKEIPSWLHDILVGFGNPNSVNYRNISLNTKNNNINNKVKSEVEVEVENYHDSFLDYDHVIESFPNCNITLTSIDGTPYPTNDDTPLPPYSLYFKRNPDGNDDIRVVPQVQNLTPFQKTYSYRNSIRFTPTQIQGLRSGMNHGLTLLVGPSGSGKTTVCTQIISNLYQNYPDQRVLIVGNSDESLKNILKILSQRNIDPRHLLHLGGRKIYSNSQFNSQYDEDFSEIGRINYCLVRRQQLLAQVQALATSLNIVGDFGNSCETAYYFQLEHIQSRIQKYYLDVNKLKLNSENVPNFYDHIFPFSNYYTTSYQELFNGSLDHNISIAEHFLNYIRNIFIELADYRSLELFQNQNHRTDYLLIKQSRIVAMTYTQAALLQSKLVELGFTYDSLFLEDSSQKFEVETLIPILLQRPESLQTHKLKRIILTGDLIQIPLVSNPVLEKYCHLNQSMMNRFIRLGVHYIELEKQEKVRPEIFKLFNWRYNSKTDHQDFGTESLFSKPNPGFVHPVQIINVSEFEGKGESLTEDQSSYYNLGEAEYVVAVYQYMRLLGYPANKITILTPYSGQCQLIQTIIDFRCKKSYFGPPNQVTTINEYNREHNEYILLSLVRTSSIDWTFDIQRLLMSCSFAKLGLYIFCRRELFENYWELKQLFHQLKNDSSSLQLLKNENWLTERSIDEEIDSNNIVCVKDVIEMGVIVYEKTVEVTSTKKKNNAK